MDTDRHQNHIFTYNYQIDGKEVSISIATGKVLDAKVVHYPIVVFGSMFMIEHFPSSNVMYIVEMILLFIVSLFIAKILHQICLRIHAYKTEMYNN